jgi:hypothetical protein
VLLEVDLCIHSNVRMIVPHIPLFVNSKTAYHIDQINAFACICRQVWTPTRFACLEPELALQHFTVSLHWNRRPEREPMMRWRLSLFSELFAAKQLDGRRAPSLAAVMPKQKCLRRFEVFPVEGGIAKFYRPPSPLICQEP